MTNPAPPAEPENSFSSLILEILPFVLVFLVALTHPLDLDLGWHLKYGEYYFRHRSLLPENTFSSAMPGYNYLNHSWGSDLILYLVFNHGGFLGVSLLGATLTTLTFYFLDRAARLASWARSLLFPVMLYLLYGMLEISFRSQYFSFLGLALLYCLLARFKAQPRLTICLLPPLFLLWANLHGQFIMGLGLLALWVVIQKLRPWLKSGVTPRLTATERWLPMAGLAVSLGATLLNPHGLELYREIFRHLGNPLQRYIAEWQPIILAPTLFSAFLCWSAFLALALATCRSREKLAGMAHYLVPLLVFFFVILDQRRYFLPYVLLSMPVANLLLEKMQPVSPARARAISLTLLGTLYLWTAVILLPAQRLFNFDWSTYCRFNSLSPRAAEFLQQIAPGHRLLSDYNMGGWLIWNYPGLKPTLDGRMPFWRDEKGYSFYEDYLALEYGQTAIDQSPFDLVCWPPSKPVVFNQLSGLAAQGRWRIIYADPFSYIFLRNSAAPAPGESGILR